jgi:hypothetical protein
MTVKPYSCWECDYFRANDPEAGRDGRCFRHAPHALDFFGFDAASTDSILTTKGDLLTHDGTDTTRLAVGSDGQIIVADSASPDGIKWIDAFESPLTTKGDLFTYSTGDARLGIGTNGQILSVDPTQPTGLKWIDMPSFSSPLTTKGDLLARSAVGDDRLPVGTDGQILEADSGEALGVKWTDPPTGSSPLTTKGDIYTRNGSADARLPIGTDGQILVADSAESTGQKWQDNPANNFIVQYQVGRLNEQLQNNLFNLSRNGLAPASGTNFPVANGYTIFDNGDIHPFAIPENGEIIALQFCFSRVAVGVGAVGASPYLRVLIVENGGSSESVRATVDLPIPAAYVDVNNNLGTSDYYCAMLKFTTPTTFTGTALWGLRIDLSNNSSDEQVSSARNLELIAYARVPISDVLDASLSPAMAMAMAPMEEPKETDLGIKTLDGGGVEMRALVEAPLDGSDAVSIEKFAYMIDGSVMWCGEFKKKPGIIPPLPEGA